MLLIPLLNDIGFTLSSNSEVSSGSSNGAVAQESLSAFEQLLGKLTSSGNQTSDEQTLLTYNEQAVKDIFFSESGTDQLISGSSEGDNESLSSFLKIIETLAGQLSDQINPISSDGNNNQIQADNTSSDNTIIENKQNFSVENQEKNSLSNTTVTVLENSTEEGQSNSSEFYSNQQNSEISTSSETNGWNVKYQYQSVNYLESEKKYSENLFSVFQAFQPQHLNGEQVQTDSSQKNFSEFNKESSLTSNLLSLLTSYVDSETVADGKILPEDLEKLQKVLKEIAGQFEQKDIDSDTSYKNLSGFLGLSQNQILPQQGSSSEQLPDNGNNYFVYDMYAEETVTTTTGKTKAEQDQTVLFEIDSSLNKLGETINGDFNTTLLNTNFSFESDKIGLNIGQKPIHIIRADENLNTTTSDNDYSYSISSINSDVNLTYLANSEEFETLSQPALQNIENEEANTVSILIDGSDKEKFNSMPSFTELSELKNELTESSFSTIDSENDILQTVSGEGTSLNNRVFSDTFLETSDSLYREQNIFENESLESNTNISFSFIEDKFEKNDTIFKNLFNVNENYELDTKVLHNSATPIQGSLLSSDINPVSIEDHMAVDEQSQGLFLSKGGDTVKHKKEFDSATSVIPVLQKESNANLSFSLDTDYGLIDSSEQDIVEARIFQNSSYSLANTAYEKNFNLVSSGGEELPKQENNFVNLTQPGDDKKTVLKQSLFSEKISEVSQGKLHDFSEETFSGMDSEYDSILNKKQHYFSASTAVSTASSDTNISTEFIVSSNTGSLAQDKTTEYVKDPTPLLKASDDTVHLIGKDFNASNEGEQESLSTEDSFMPSQLSIKEKKDENRQNFSSLLSVPDDISTEAFQEQSTGSKVESVDMSIEAQPLVNENSSASKKSEADNPFKESLSVTKQLEEGVREAVRMNKNRAVLHLNPPELGSVKIRLSVSSGNEIRAIFIADNPDTLQLIDSSMGTLKTQLAENGFSLENANVGADQQEMPDQQDSRHQNFERPRKGRSYKEIEEDNTNNSLIEEQVQKIQTGVYRVM